MRILGLFLLMVFLASCSSLWESTNCSKSSKYSVQSLKPLLDGGDFPPVAKLATRETAITNSLQEHLALLSPSIEAMDVANQQKQTKIAFDSANKMLEIRNEKERVSLIIGQLYYHHLRRLESEVGPIKTINPPYGINEDCIESDLTDELVNRIMASYQQLDKTSDE